MTDQLSRLQLQVNAVFGIEKLWVVIKKEPLEPFCFVPFFHNIHNTFADDTPLESRSAICFFPQASFSRPLLHLAGPDGSCFIFFVYLFRCPDMS